MRRPEQGRVVGGVCGALATHLGLPLGGVRVAMVFLGLAGGAGVLLYVFWWVTVPSADADRDAAAARPAALSRLARRPVEAGRRLPVRDVALGLILLGAAALLLAARHGVDVAGSWMLPVLVALAGVGLAWSQLDAAQRGRWLSQAGGRTPAGVLRLVGGLALVVVGVVLLVVQGSSVSTVLRAAVAALAVLAGVVVVLAPWWLRLVRELGDERAARAREAERADIAAHLHDSVLQTLALIRRASHDPEAVARMARSQERELREWLYNDRPSPGTSVAAEVRTLVGEVEDTRIAQADGVSAAVAVDVVVVGDCAPDDQTAALLQATREALVNAVAHGAPPVSVYVEVRDEHVEAFVRDRGDGFDPDDVAPDRFGLRESIRGRVARRGGTTEVVSRPGWGTEVRMSVPRTTARAQATGEQRAGEGS
ncbi:phage shock protein C (PspC) family protein [Sediminihabitans luteus]|uniref:Phage shock protein C (PspC) family protein n=1 Tax=Sediminihabitans luteus TaxID=1138585 RepID=A0A2M9CZ06_9CELL|nr:ATP-binding protein [Sediminihabitans luteus]PJJ77174.1 phage shock protein C (PspC) family protein [Sediminihabitans luteus]